MRWHLTFFAGVVLLLSQNGCGQADPDAHAEDHHLEHFVPHHKPANFAESVEDIEHRSEHLTAHAGHGHDDEAEEFQELLDIVDWIPELAADSDLNEAAWQQAVDAGQQLSHQLATRTSQDGSLDLTGLSQAIAEPLKVLQALVPDAGTPEPEIHHDHDHHHGHEHEHQHDDHHEHEDDDEHGHDDD